MNAKALRELLVKVEAGKWGPWTFEVLGDDAEGYALDAFHGSLDAALALHNAVLPDWIIYRLSSWPGHDCEAEIFGTHEHKGERWHTFTDGRSEGKSDHSIARALLIAILKALIAEAEQ